MWAPDGGSMIQGMAASEFLEPGTNGCRPDRTLVQVSRTLPDDRRNRPKQCQSLGSRPGSSRTGAGARRSELSRLPFVRRRCDARSSTSPSGNTGNLMASNTVSEPLVAHVRNRGIASSSLLLVQLQLQRSLVSRDGRLDPADTLIDAAAASPPTERRENMPAWATKLHAERMKIEKERS